MTRPVKRTCPQCGDQYWNQGAHAECCRGPLKPLDDKPDRRPLDPLHDEKPSAGSRHDDLAGEPTDTGGKRAHPEQTALTVDELMRNRRRHLPEATA